MAACCTSTRSICSRIISSTHCSTWRCPAVNIVEREGLSHRHDAQFVLIGSMNPEEGELRPQLLDRFGLCVSVAAPIQIEDRTEVLRRRLAFDRDPGADRGFAGDDEGLSRAVLAATPALVPDDVLVAAARLAVAVGAEGMRADLTLCRAASAYAGLDGRAATTVEDLRRVAPMVLAHRTRRGPFDPPTLPPQELERALSDALGAPSDNDTERSDTTQLATATVPRSTVRCPSARRADRRTSIGRTSHRRGDGWSVTWPLRPRPTHPLQCWRRSVISGGAVSMIPRRR
jgi:Mg-chelatase subunit ChlI